eukprot:UN09907
MRVEKAVYVVIILRGIFHLLCGFHHRHCFIIMVSLHSIFCLLSIKLVFGIYWMSGH